MLNSKLFFVAIASVSLIGCASKAPIHKLKGYEGPEAMQRNEVVQASKQCIYARLRPNVEYLAAKTDSGKVLVPVNVHCEPY
jgi:hypothetical protein